MIKKETGKTLEQIHKPEIVAEARDEVIRRSEATNNMETIILMFLFSGFL